MVGYIDGRVLDSVVLGSIGLLNWWRGEVGLMIAFVQLVCSLAS
jgi:hypothetical protein